MEVPFIMENCPVEKCSLCLDRSLEQKHSHVGFVYLVLKHIFDCHVTQTPATRSAYDSLIDTSPTTTDKENLFADFSSAAANNSFSDFNPRGTTSPASNKTTDFATFQSAPLTPT